MSFRKPLPQRMSRDDRLRLLIDSTLPRPAARMATNLASQPPRQAVTEPLKQARKASADLTGYMGAIASLPCVLCARLHRATKPVEVHHLRTGHGASDRASDFLTMPLCPECHRGTHGMHGTKQLLRQAGCTELDLLADAIQQLWRTHAPASR